jgi:hypothetical protein
MTDQFSIWVNPAIKYRLRSITSEENAFDQTYTNLSFNVGMRYYCYLDSMGQVFYEKNINLNNSLSFPININDLKKGVYYLFVRSREGVFSKKMVVQ